MPRHPDLTAYVLGELRSEEIDAHVRGCRRCSRDLERIRAVHAALQNPPRYKAPVSAPRQASPAQSSSWPRLTLAAAVLAAVALVVFLRSRPAGEPLGVQTLTGMPRLAGRQLSRTGTLDAGETIETDSRSSARVKVAGLGEVDLLPGSKLRLLKSNSKSRRFALDRGSLRATVSAPPRLFVVDTPSVSAVDLGCAYELTVLPSGGTRLRVTSGWVVLESKAGSAYVRSGMVCESDRSGKLQTPYYEDADPRFKEALSHFDQSLTGPEAVLEGARHRDGLSVWHLFHVCLEGDRGKIYDRLAQLSPPPPGVTREGILRLDATMLRLWREDIAPVDDLDFWK